MIKKPKTKRLNYKEFFERLLKLMMQESILTLCCTHCLHKCHFLQVNAHCPWDSLHFYQKL